MAIDELISALEREAAAEVAALAAAARADAARLRTDAAARRTARRTALLARCRAEHQAAADAALAATARQARRDVLTARAAALDRLEACIGASLPALLRGADGDRVLDALVAGLVAAAGDRARVRCAPALVEGVRARLAAHPALEVEADPTVIGGAIGERAGGRVVVDATLGSLLARMWPRLRLEAQPVAAPVPTEVSS
ncbi:MAG: hypothetical protein IPL61_26270 [Myxococcales bacterium]|nr:hypothetical protein [Myxococcales bacterium]